MRIASPELIKDLVSKNERIDSRKMLEYRKISGGINPISKAEGSCYLSIGETKVLVGIKFGLMKPYPDTPDEGGMMVSLNYNPVVWKDLPPNMDIEVSRVLDRSIRESKMIDLKEFCITPEEQAFQIFIDCYVLNYDGNLLDALNLAAVKALLNMKMPELENNKIVISDRKINLRSIPVVVTISSINNKYVVDLNSLEEKAADFSVSISYLNEKTICAMQKTGTGGIPMKELQKIFEIGAEKQKELRMVFK
ncbi:MAG: RNA-binding protein [Candidatus Aenigmatarchaeota archaeon]|nr:MAG: RNA-binding protein [Candidatus Aenigmarchaeota archaeon]